VINAIITIRTLNSNKRLSVRLTTVINPSLQAIEDFKKMMIESKMYTTNWVFLRSNSEDKEALEKIHNSTYRDLKSRFNFYVAQWENRNWVDSLNNVYKGFEELLVDEAEIMKSLKRFTDYDDPVIKLGAERMLEEEILPHTATLINELNIIQSHGIEIRAKESIIVERSSMRLRLFIILLAITIVCIGFFLSIYMTRLIIGPIRHIRYIINDLGKGVIRKIEYPSGKNEIGMMVQSVNNLSEKLESTANFAREVGMRNFNIPFNPLSDEDILGKALITMRENLRTNERHLLEANSEIQSVFKASLDAIIIIDEEGKVVKWDNKMEILFGWTENEMIGTELSESIIPLRFREAHQKGMAHFLKTKEGPILGKTIEVKALKKNNEEFDISLSISPSFIKDKYRFIGFIRDITARKKSEAELQRSEERYRQIVETAQEGIWLIDENDFTTFINKKMCEIVEYSAEELMGERIYAFMDDESRKNSLEQIERRKQGISETHDSVFITKSGKHVWVTISTNPVWGEDRKYKGALAMMTNITDRKLHEALLKKSEASLEINNKELERKNKELEQFAYVASHDMQEPLRTTSSFVELLHKQYKGKLDEKADKYLTYIIQASDRMKVLIKDLLEYSRIGKQKNLNQVDCNIMMNEVIADLGTAIDEAGAQINIGAMPIINGYATEIKQLFQNLITNAIKFRRKDTGSTIDISVVKKDEYWQFSFADNGIGIPEKHNERIFVIFQRLHTRDEFPGSGIGLSHCKKIVELHKGKIWVESVPSQGSTFYFTIPQNSIL